MLKCIIVDDEQALINELEFLLKDIEEIEIVASFINGVYAFENIKNMNVDIVFLDIEMPGITGIELGKKIMEIDKNIKIVFTTAYKHYALDAFDLGAVHYLLKPIRKEKLLTAIDRIKESFEGQFKLIDGSNKLPAKISIKGKEDITFVKLKDILYIESLNSKTILVTKREKHMSKEKMQYWENELEKVGFMRCHRCYIVNTDYIYRIKRILGNAYELLLDCQELIIPVGRTYIQDVKKKLYID